VKSRPLIATLAIGVSFLAAALTGVVGATASTSDWTQWRGPQRDGTSGERGLLKQWPAGGPKLLWQVNDIGDGYSTPTVVGRRIYLMSNRGMENEFVQALSTDDGKPVWTTRVGNVGNPNQNPPYAKARSTPTVDGDYIYALGSDGDLACLEARTGKIRWQKNVRQEFGGQPGEWAYAESPLVDGDLVVVTPGGTEATLAALNKKTGDVIWKSAVPGAADACYASATIMEVGGVKQYVQFLKVGVIGVDAKTGKFLWKFDKTAETRMGGNIPTPVAYHEYVYSASGMTGGGMAKISSTGGTFSAESVYFGKKMPAAIGGVVPVGDYLYGTGSQTLNCVELKTGTVKWEERCVGPGSICYADGRLYLHGENNEVALVEATPDGFHEKGHFTPPNPPTKRQERAWAYPVVANGRLYIRDLGTLWCYDVKGSGAK
jgi:outer membrane protein assembly factor BamB